MRKSRDFLSLPVVSLDEGKEIGRVRSLVINPNTGEVAALMVQSGGFFGEQKVIPYPRVVSAGNNALTVQKTSSAEKLTSLPQIINLVKENVQLKGSRVITEGGTALGVVMEFFVDPATGKITAFEIGGKFNDKLLKGRAVLPAGEVRTIGKDVLVVHNGAGEALIPGERPLAESMRTIKESAQRVFHKAWHLRLNPNTGEAQPVPEETAPPAGPAQESATEVGQEEQKAETPKEVPPQAM